MIQVLRHLKSPSTALPHLVLMSLVGSQSTLVLPVMEMRLMDIKFRARPQTSPSPHVTA